MKIIVDENMQYAYELFSTTGQVLAVPGRYLTKNELKDADALIVRSVTNVNAELLEGTSVKFVGTATSGIDHVDDIALSEAGIGFCAAFGCNAIAVVEYVFSILLLLAEHNKFDLRDCIVGIVGVGNIGRCLQKRLKIWGVKTLLCDPPRADRGDKGDFYSLNELASQANIITFHIPLFKNGNYKSWHIIDSDFLNKLQTNTILINTCRGPIIDNKALLKVLYHRKDLIVALDVWENEPNISLELLNKVHIGTPHIAGYTFEGKICGIVQIFEAWCEFINQPRNILMEDLLPQPEFNVINFNGTLDQFKLKRLVHLVYDVRDDDASLRKLGTSSGGFDYLRKNYHQRREWSSLQVICDNAQSYFMLKKLGFKVKLQD